jgi:hypothetical protein
MKGDLRRKAQEFGRMVSADVWIVLLVLTFAICIGSWMVKQARVPSLGPRFLYALIGVFVGWIFGFAVYWLRTRGSDNRVLEPIPKTRSALFAFCVALACAVVITVLTDMANAEDLANYAKEHPKLGPLGEIAFVLEHHGSLFDWIVGSLTVVGVWLTYNSILEARRIITSFGDLYARVLALIAETKEKPQTGKLRFLAYTMSIGYLALRQEDWDKLAGELTTLDKTRLEIVCLDDDDLKTWHNKYIGRSTARKRNLTLFDTINATIASQTVADMATKGGTLKKKKMEAMPGFYLIFNDLKAIIVAPFFIPLPLGSPFTQGNNTDRVQMLGFETTDRRILDDVTNFFNYHRGDDDASASEEEELNTSIQDEARVASSTGNFCEVLGKITEQCKVWQDEWEGDEKNQKAAFFRYRISIEQAQDPSNWLTPYLRSRIALEKKGRRPGKWIDDVKFVTEDSTLIVQLPKEHADKWKSYKCDEYLNQVAVSLNMKSPKIEHKQDSPKPPTEPEPVSKATTTAA